MTRVWIKDTIWWNNQNVANLISCLDIQGADDCWNWKYFHSGDYPSIKIDGETWIASRASFLIFNHYLDLELQVCHKCDNPHCCNPTHLYLGTEKENMMDTVQRKHTPTRHELFGSKYSPVHRYTVQEYEDLIISLARIFVAFKGEDM